MIELKFLFEYFNQIYSRLKLVRFIKSDSNIFKEA